MIMIVVPRPFLRATLLAAAALPFSPAQLALM